MPIRQACEIVSVPQSSFHGRVSGKVDCKARSGPTPYLSFESSKKKSSSPVVRVSLHVQKMFVLFL